MFPAFTSTKGPSHRASCSLTRVRAVSVLTGGMARARTGQDSMVAGHGCDRTWLPGHLHSVPHSRELRMVWPCPFLSRTSYAVSPLPSSTSSFPSQPSPNTQMGLTKQLG